MYDHVAEHLADHDGSVSDGGDDCGGPGMDDEDKNVNPGNPVMSASIDGKDEKWYMPCRVDELYDTYLYMYAMSDHKASRKTWGKAFKNWKHCLKQRKKTQHARCYLCSVIAKEKSLALDAAGHQECIEAKHDHLRVVFGDRKVSSRIKALSEEYFHSGNIPCEDGTGYLLIDAVDQAKLKTPRNLDANKLFEACWRPQLHMIGVLVHGCLEVFYITDADVPKDSNLELTLISHTWDDVHDWCTAKGLVMPHTWVLLADNTAREMKNKFCLAWTGWVVAKGNIKNTYFVSG